MIEIISNHFQSSLLEHGKLRLQYSKVDLTSLLKDSIQHHLLWAREKQVTIHLNSPFSTIVRADAHRLMEIFDQLIHNAVKFSRASGIVEIDILEQGNNYAVRITDYGEGFLPRQKSKLFQKYMKLANPIGGEDNASGLGLSICKKIVEMHKGKIEAESAGIGMGSSFTVYLPASAA